MILNNKPKKIIGNNIITLELTDSTNLQLKNLCEKETLSAGFVLVAKQQTNGKGTDGNYWVSELGNIYASILFDYDDKVNTLFSLYPAVALAKILRRDFNINAHVKWPNDVLVEHKKIAGILCEGVAGKYMIMGIGINVLQTNFSGDIENIATSIAAESNSNIDTNAVLEAFLREYNNLYFGKCDIRQEWLNNTQMIGKTINSIHDGEKKSVVVTGMSPEGFLEVKNKLGQTEIWMARRGLDINAKY